ncbi:uncharacterized protein LOC123446458 isoform X1 [Hordeum vulgare subsp. vulgare]|uniref:uncharacterized protein LOC123446458 isoform X1 n=1 Tax=Hordeum vulgare subsp. vulgare TaxID=112509 RepID=UPI001D1A36F5|nr:uncharacterized protein LOC123446458 isoform X1 [Hordeum vulgare subsp. vulgare]
MFYSANANVTSIAGVCCRWQLVLFLRFSLGMKLLIFWHVNLVDGQLQKLLYSGQLDQKEVDRLAVISMAGLAAVGLEYDKVVGQSADLFTLQRFLNRTKTLLGKAH